MVFSYKRYSPTVKKMTNKLITSLLIVYSSSKGLSTGHSWPSLGRKKTQERGFLLIEMMIALAAVAIFSGMVAYLQGQSWSWRHDARCYLEATTLAAAYFEHAQRDISSIEVLNKNSNFTVNTRLEKPDETIPFQLLTVTLSWRTARGIKQEISITGGIVTHEKI